jgi:hypothetical protein
VKGQRDVSSRRRVSEILTLATVSAASKMSLVPYLRRPNCMSVLAYRPRLTGIDGNLNSSREPRQGNLLRLAQSASQAHHQLLLTSSGLATCPSRARLTNSLDILPRSLCRGRSSEKVQVENASQDVVLQVLSTLGEFDVHSIGIEEEDTVG